MLHPPPLPSIYLCICNSCSAEKNNGGFDSHLLSKQVNKPPSYRMPPQPPPGPAMVYSESTIPGATASMDLTSNVGMTENNHDGNSALRTHSSKFPIEKELILSGDKGSTKIPLMNDYRTPPAGFLKSGVTLQMLPRPASASIAPDHPKPKHLQAWNSLPQQQSAQLPPKVACGAIPRTPARLPEDVTALAERENNSKNNELRDSSKNAVSKTYHTLKDLISSKFRKDNSEGVDELNNVHPSQISGNQCMESMEHKSPYMSLPAHLRQNNGLNNSQPNIWSDRSASGSPRIPYQHHQIPPRPYTPADVMRNVNQQQKAMSQPQLNIPKDHEEAPQSFHHQHVKAVKRSSLANIDMTDSDEGGFVAQPPRVPVVYHPGEKPHGQMYGSRPQSSQGAIPFQSAYATNLQQQLSYQGNKDSQTPTPGSYHQQQHQVQEEQMYKSQNDQKDCNSSYVHPDRVWPYPKPQMQEPPKIPQKPDHKTTTEVAKPISGSGASSDYDKSGNQSSNVDSGRGSAAYSSCRKGTTANPPAEHPNPPPRAKENDSEWADIVDAELRQILEPGMQNLSMRPESTISGSASSVTPPLPPLSPGGSTRYTTPGGQEKSSGKQEYGADSYNRPGRHSGPIGPSRAGWPGSAVQKQGHVRSGTKRHEQTLLKRHLFGLDNDVASTTTRSLDLESLLGAPWCAGQSVSDSETDTQGLRHIRSQLEGLEYMYSEVLRIIGSKIPGIPNRLQDNPRIGVRRRQGSLSSLPSSSVSGRPIRERRRTDERRKVRDMKGINKRFQRLESHVVTLARSVAHLSSEMRSQHVVTQELERLRDDLATLRLQTNHSMGFQSHGGANAESPNLTNPKRVKKLTKFFGEDPPLMRLFLKKLGYEKYATLFESEKVGMIELPYLGEERLQKLGVPLGPRLRILQEAQISLCKDTTLCIV
uniref:SAM domain-containing protein n=2 Tax=Lutzomyia longipalpis TaxID=7200 RepID=A0A1B0CBE2_LUTLO